MKLTPDAQLLLLMLTVMAFFFMMLIVEALGVDLFCKIFTFMDWNGEGAHDDLPFCWTPLKGIVR